jgi:hypothetical protein
MMLEDFSDELKFGEGSGVEDQLIANLEGEVQSLKAKLADALMGTWSGRAMLEDGEDMASLSSLQKQLALSKVDAATLQEEVVAARQANERLIAENHRIAEKVRALLSRNALKGEPLARATAKTDVISLLSYSSFSSLVFDAVAQCSMSLNHRRTFGERS